MVRDEKKYQKARDFRKQGFSYSEIAKIVGVSKATISNWFGKQAFSKQVRKDNEIRTRRDNVKRISLLNKAKKSERETKYKEAVRSAEVEYKHYKSSPLFTAGIIIYKSLGDLVHPTRIRVPTSRKDTHKIFIKFLKEFLGVDKSKIYTKVNLTIVDSVVLKRRLVRWVELMGKTVGKT